MYLFFIYGLFLSILLGIFFVFTYTHYKTNTLTEAKKDTENLCVSISNAVVNQLDNLSTVSMNIVYSNAIKENFKEFSTLYQQTGSSPDALVASREKAQAIHDIVTAIIGAYQTATETKLYTMDGSCVESGYWLRTSNIDLESLPWFEEVMRLNGHKYITAPTINKELPSGDGNSKNHKYISLVRLFLDYGGKPEGIVEVVQDCDKIFSFATQIERKNPGTNVYVYNSRQELVYPYNGSDQPDYYSEIGVNNLIKADGKIIETQDGSSFLFAYEAIQDYDWTIIVTKTKEAVYLPLHIYRSMFTGIAILSILVAMLVCFYISQRLTKPLQKLTDATGKITINRVLSEDKVSLTSANSNIREISMLCESIRTMYEKLRSTSQDVLLSRSEETKAKLQATQSLINPHFLYNSLTNISIMAEEEMNDDIVKICHSLCNYFRYVASGQEMVVSLEEEMYYTKCYLECMKFRFGDELVYDIKLPKNADQFYIPKLISQPIVENAFKYAFDITPPWELSISAEVQNGSWILKIQDNGGNLSDAKRLELLSLYKNLDLNKELKSMQIGGMGLKNVYLRLKLLYGDKAIFKIDNSLPKRTIFILGGPIHKTKEEFYHEHPQL